jgi:hypothetical protein
MTTPDGYHNAEHHRRRAEFLRKLLFGLLGGGEINRQAHHHGLDPGREYLTFRARPGAGMTMDDLVAAYGLKSGQPHGGLCAMAGTDLVCVVTTPPRVGDLGVCGVGPPRSLERIAESFRMATRAVDTADRHGLRGMHEFSQLGLLPAISSDGAVSEALCRRYLGPLGQTESAAEVADTVHIYLLEGMNVARTAERLFVHQNTVRYRISRFEELTGVSLRERSTVIFEVLWALEHRRPMRTKGAS